MSLTINTGASSTAVLALNQRLANGFVHQIYGADYTDLTRVTSTLNIGKTDTAKVREAVLVSYVNAAGEAKRAYASLEFTIPVDCPQAVAEKLTYMVGDLARESQTIAMVVNRSLIEA